MVNLKTTNIRVCPACFDPDHPQNQLGRHKVVDPQALRNARPDTGLEDSRFGDSIRYEFDTQDSADLWNVDAVYADATVTWQSPSETILLTATEVDPKLYRSSTVSDPISFDPAVYRYVRCRFKVNEFNTSPDPPVLDRYASWNGLFCWIRESDTDAGSGPTDFVGERCHTVGRPDLEQMGDPWQLITWDMEGVTNWSTGSNINALRIDFLKTDFTVVEVDYISVDTGPQDQ